MINKVLETFSLTERLKARMNLNFTARKINDRGGKDG